MRRPAWLVGWLSRFRRKSSPRVERRKSRRDDSFQILSWQDAVIALMIIAAAGITAAVFALSLGLIELGPR